MLQNCKIHHESITNVNESSFSSIESSKYILIILVKNGLIFDHWMSRRMPFFPPPASTKFFFYSDNENLSWMIKNFDLFKKISVSKRYRRWRFVAYVSVGSFDLFYSSVLKLSVHHTFWKNPRECSFCVYHSLRCRYPKWAKKTYS